MVQLLLKHFIQVSPISKYLLVRGKCGTIKLAVVFCFVGEAVVIITYSKRSALRDDDSRDDTPDTHFP